MSLAREAPFFLALVVALAGCREESASAPSATASTSAAPSVPAPDEPAPWEVCATRIEALRGAPDEADNGPFEGARLAYVATVPGATGWWKRLPQAGDVPAAVAKDLAAAAKKKRPLPAVRRLIRRHRKHPERLRAALLHEGYLYVEGGAVALAVVQQIGLQHLFEAPRLFLLRDGTIHALRRHDDHYVHAEGPDEGARAEIWFGDRVGEDREALFQGPLFVSFRTARDELGFDRVRALHLRGDELAAELRYDGEWVPAVLDVSRPEARLECHGADLEAEAMAPHVKTARSQAVVFRRLREVVTAQVREELPFDAPKGGGADDGDKYPLRARWKDAYQKGLPRFRYAGRSYDVFDADGRPMVPQVCIDFVYDSWERAAGTWWPPQSAEAKARVGEFSLDDLALEERRRVQHFLDFAHASAEHFEVWDNPTEDQVLYTDRDAFLGVLQKHAEAFRRGDLLIVRRRRSNGRALHHSLLVMETDPLLGVPTWLAGNAAVPRLQTFEGAMLITPKRFLQMRIRPSRGWFDRAVLEHLDQEAP